MIHHGERFTDLPSRKYVDGEVAFMDLIDIEQCFGAEGNYDEPENEDGGEGEDYEADYGSESKEDEDKDGSQSEEEDEGDDEDKNIKHIVDEEHIVDEVKVEMNGFKFKVEAKEMVRAHAVEARRNIMIVKNDKIRIRVDCFGVVPVTARMIINKGKEEVIENGVTLPKTKVVKGVIKVMHITTGEEKAQRRLDVKARSTLMMGIPNEHQLNFNSIKVAKQLLKAVKKRFEMLDPTFNRLQKLNTHAVVWRNKANLDTMSMDDLYNNLKVYELEVKGMSSSSSSTRNTAFVSSLNNNTSSTNGAVNTGQAVNTAHGASTVSTQVNAAYYTNIDNLSDAIGQAEKGPNYALMAFSSLSFDSKVSNNSTCLKSCLETIELLKSQNEQLLKDVKKYELMVLGYKTDEFVNKPIVEKCEAKSSEEEPKVVRKNDDALIIKEWVSDNEEKDVFQFKIEKKIVRPSIAKIEFVKSKQQEKTTRKIVKQVEQHRQNTHSKNVNTARPKAVVNVVKGNNVNAVKASDYHLGKFDGKADEGFFVGYSLNSKAFRVVNSRTRIVEENLHISDDGKKVDEDPSKESKCKDQEKKNNVNNTNNVNTISLIVNVAGINEVNVVGEIISSGLPFDPNMPTSEDISIFDFSNNDEDDDLWSTAKAKTNNKEAQIHAKVDGKKIIVTESSARRDLRLADEEGNRLVRTTTIASSIEAEYDSGNITKTQSKATPNESSSQGTNSGGGPRCQKTIGDTTAQTRFESASKHFNDSLLARGDTLQRGSKREKINKSRTHRMKRLYKGGLTTRVESSGVKEILGEDASKQARRIDAIVSDADITLVNVQDDAEMFDLNVLDGEELFVARQNTNVVEELVDDAQVKGIVFQEPEEPVKPEKKDQIRLDEKVSLKLKAEFDKEIDVDHQLAERLQAQEQEEFSDVEKATLFLQLLEKRRKHFAAKRAQEKRNKPSTQAQQRKIMCTYLKNMKGYKLKDLKLKELDRIQEMFNRAFIRVNTFEDFRTKLVEGKEKRAGEELILESIKKQKVEDDKETTKLKQLMEIIP
nr:ribonuclease H-like domain-containing protein [Tanacetum cinerariifolium]